MSESSVDVDKRELGYWKMNLNKLLRTPQKKEQIKK